MAAAMAEARHEVWLATYIFHDDGAGRAVADALVAAARAAWRCGVVVDGFGSMATLDRVRAVAGRQSGVELEVFRPLDRWWSWLQPGQLRRLHQKLCVVDREVAFVGGINIIDDRNDLHHGWQRAAAAGLRRGAARPAGGGRAATAQAMWTRARLGHGWRDEVRRWPAAGGRWTTRCA
jgi:cardiolipin synthase